MNQHGKKILIIGNGFDIAHGLPTRYKDFLEFCKRIEYIFTFCGDEESAKKYEINSIDNWEINNDIKTKVAEMFNDCQRGSYNNGKSNKYFSYERCAQEIYECLAENIWYKYFLKLYEENIFKGENWIDFESEISHIIEYVDRNSKNISAPYQSLRDLLFIEAKNDNKIKILNNLLHHAVEVFIKTISEIKTIRDFREKCFKDLEKLTRALELYLAGFVEKIHIDVKSPDIEKINPDYVISFNYTNTFTKYYNSSAEVFYIHGKCEVNNNIASNNMVLGIDEYWSETERDTHTNFSIFKKFVQRIRKKTGTKNHDYIREINEFYKNTQEIPVIGKENTCFDGTSLIYVFGHSLDTTDKDVLIDFLKSAASAITIYCYDKGAEGELIANAIKIIGQKTLLEKANQSPAKIEFKIQQDMSE